MDSEKQRETPPARTSDDAAQLRQDAVSMNVQRACELAIDMAHHVIKVKKLGLPQDSRESFSLPHHGGLISEEQMRTLQSMVGFRNILLHEY